MCVSIRVVRALATSILFLCINLFRFRSRTLIFGVTVRVSVTYCHGFGRVEFVENLRCRVIECVEHGLRGGAFNRSTTSSPDGASVQRVDLVCAV